MKTSRLLTGSLTLLAALAALSTQPNLSAQGRAAGAPAAPTDAEAAAALATAVTAARAAVATATFAEPRNDADVRSKIETLRNAELTQASLLSDQFQTQVSTLIQTGLRAGQAGGRGGGRGAGPRPAITTVNDYTGFTSIFDGTLKNWDGPTNFFSAEDGMLHSRALGTTTYIIWTGGSVKDFELKMDIKLTGGINAGIQYRSWRTAGMRGASEPQNKAISDLDASIASSSTALNAARVDLLNATFAEVSDPAALRAKVEAVRAAEQNLASARATGFAAIQSSANKLSPELVQTLTQTGARRGGAITLPAAAGAPAGGGRGGGNFAQWNVNGYQFDMDSPNNQFTGMLYEQGGRGIITQRGDIGILPAGGGNGAVNRIALVGDGNQTQYIQQGEFNTYHLIARGNTLIHMINGHLMSISFDENPVSRSMEGIIAFEIESNGEAFVKNVYLKNL